LLSVKDWTSTLWNTTLWNTGSPLSRGRRLNLPHRRATTKNPTKQAWKYRYAFEHQIRRDLLQRFGFGISPGYRAEIDACRASGLAVTNLVADFARASAAAQFVRPESAQD
jgi:hypothetical protein